MKKVAAFFIVCLAANFALAADCFNSERQRITYENGLSLPADNEAATVCLKAKLDAKSLTLNADVQALRKSGNLGAVTPQIVNIFITAPAPQNSFTAAAALAAVPEELVNYRGKFLDVLSSAQLPDYKKTLAVIILTSMDAADAQYTPFLTPALEADDAALSAYSAGAYAILIPGTGDKYIKQIIQLYTFDKVLAQKAFAATQLKQKALAGYLKDALKSDSAQLRVAAIEWLADLGDKNTLALLSIPQAYDDAATLSAAANGLVKNYTLAQSALKKAMRTSPKSNESAIAVMAYAFMGSKTIGDIETMLKNGNTNEKINALRVVSSIAAILLEKPQAFANPELEKLKLKKLIAPSGHLAKTGNDEIRPYADNTLKELYKLLNK